MEQVTIYRAKGKQIGLVFLFKYCLNGHIRGFSIDSGELNEIQQKWLFSSNFPSNEEKMIDWKVKMSEKFEVEVSPADTSFEALWELYDYKISKADSIKAFKKLSPGDQIKCFIDVPFYKKYLEKNPGIGILHLSTYINKRRFEDERPGKATQKVYNKSLHYLADKKTNK